MAYPIHPAAELFPMMPMAELRELAEDIKSNGLLERIVLHDGQILDGRNRYAACQLAAIDPQFQNPEHRVDSPVLYVISKNLHRRHLTTGQRAAIAVGMLPLMEEEAKHRQGARNDLSTSCPIGQEVGSARELAAKALGIGEGSVQRAIKAQRDNPEGFEKVKRGELSVNAAANGHTQVPSNIDRQTEDINTGRGKVRAAAHRRRMIDVLSSLNGLCFGLPTLELSLIAAVSDDLGTWVTQVENNIRALRKFAADLRTYANTETRPHGKDSGGQLGDSPSGAEEAGTCVAEKASQ